MTNDNVTHIPEEVLALLVDEAPSLDQLEHLSQCAACTANLDAMRAQYQQMSHLSDMTSPDQWERIAFAAHSARKSRSRIVWPLVSAIAAVVLFAFGWVMGSATDHARTPTEVAVIEPPSNPTNRLAALETIVLATGAALVKSPDDAMLQQLHNDALQRRDSLIAQIPVVGDNARWF